MVITIFEVVLTEEGRLRKRKPGVLGILHLLRGQQHAGSIQLLVLWNMEVQQALVGLLGDA